MAIKHIFSDLLGTTLAFFRIGKTGPRLKDTSGALGVRNSLDSADVKVIASTFDASGDVGLTINSDSAGTGADWRITVQRPVAGMSSDLTLTLPVGPGSTGQVLSTDGTGVTSWISVATEASWTAETTSFTFGSGSTVSMFTLPSNAVIDNVKLIVDTVFDGTPTATVGLTGDTARYMGAGMNWLDELAVFETTPGILANSSTEALEIAFSPGGATAGAARVVVTYATPL